MAKTTLHDRSFNSKGHAMQYVRGLLDGGALEAPYDKLPTLRLISWLSQIHPTWDQKRGPGIRYITVRENQPYGSRGFWLIRTDGVEIDVSYKPYRTDKVRKMTAFRNAVRGQIEDVRFSTQWPIVCPITNKVLSSDKGSCHHAWPFPFTTLVENFLEERGLMLTDIPTEAPIGKPGHWFTDEVLCKQWQDYHEAHAILIIVDSEWNTRAGNKPYEEE